MDGAPSASLFPRCERGGFRGALDEDRLTIQQSEAKAANIAVIQGREDTMGHGDGIVGSVSRKGQATNGVVASQCPPRQARKKSKRSSRQNRASPHNAYTVSMTIAIPGAYHKEPYSALRRGMQTDNTQYGDFEKMVSVAYSISNAVVKCFM